MRGFALGLAGALVQPVDVGVAHHSTFVLALATFALADGISVVLIVNGVGKLALALGLRTIVSRVTTIRAFAGHVRSTTNETAAVLALALPCYRRGSSGVRA